MYWYTSKHVDEHLMCVCVYNCFGNRKVLVSYLYHNVTPHMCPAVEGDQETHILYSRHEQEDTEEKRELSTTSCPSSRVQL